MQPESRLVPTAMTEDLSNELALVSIFRRHNDEEFRWRLYYWLVATGLDCGDGCTTNELITAMDAERLQALGRVLFKELTQRGLYAPAN